MKLRALAAGACMAAACAALPVLAAPARPAREPVSFQFKDWELQCDNTRTCRAAGYQAESGDSEPVSLLLVRAAGPGAPVEVSLQVGGDEPVKGTLRLSIGKAAIAGLAPDTAVLTPAQAAQVLPELLRNDTAQVSAGKKTFTLSLAGANAVLLKMDEAQGRVGTPGALVRKGTQPEAAVPAPVLPPLVANVLPVPARPGDAALARAIFPTLDLTDAKEQCNQGDKLDAKSLQVNRLTASRVLVSLACGTGAYNGTSLLWIANDRPPFGPTPLEADGEFDPADGSVHSAMKGRGIGDCWALQTWHFTGSDFTLTSTSGDGMCRGFAGGAWNLSSYTARLAQPPKTKKP